MPESLINEDRRWEIFMHSAAKGGKTEEVLDRALRLVKVGSDFMEVSAWMMTEWNEELVPFRVHAEKIVSVNDGRGDASGQPGFAVVEMPDDEGNRRESYHRVGSLQNAAYRKVLNDARRFMAEGASVVLHCGYEPNTSGWTTVINGSKVTPPHLKRVFHIEKRFGQGAAPVQQQPQPAAQVAPPAEQAAPAQPAPQPPAPAPEPQFYGAAAEQPRMAPEAAPAPVAESIAELEARLAAAKAAAHAPVQEVPAPVAPPSDPNAPKLPSDEEWQKLYAKMKGADRRKLNERAISEGWAGHSPTQQFMAQAWTALAEGGYLTEDQILAVMDPQGAAA